MLVVFITAGWSHCLLCLVSEFLLVLCLATVPLTLCLFCLQPYALLPRGMGLQGPITTCLCSCQYHACHLRAQSGLPCPAVLSHYGLLSTHQPRILYTLCLTHHSHDNIAIGCTVHQEQFQSWLNSNKTDGLMQVCILLVSCASFSNISFSAWPCNAYSQTQVVSGHQSRVSRLCNLSVPEVLGLSVSPVQARPAA